MAPKQKVKGSNPRLCRMFLKQRRNRSSQLLWPKRRFFFKKMFIIIRFKARNLELRYRFLILKGITNLTWQKSKMFDPGF